MYLKYVNISLIFIILNYLCLGICSQEIGMEQYRVAFSPDPKDCNVRLTNSDIEMPLIYSPVTNKTIYPNKQGYIIIKQNSTIRMSCSGEKNYFVSPISNKNIKDIEVKCTKPSILEYNGSDHSFNDYRCLTFPVSKMKIVNKPCYHGKGQLLDIGFETRNSFNILYRICFNTTTKIPVYAWYTTDIPVSRFVQNSTIQPSYIKTNLYDPIDVKEAYEKQQDTMIEIMKAERLGKWYIQLNESKSNDNLRYLVKGHLMSEKEFIYSYEQHATYYYENTAPQWLVYNKDAKRYMERYFRRNMFRRRSKHLVVSGTFKINEPLNHKLERTKLYLSLPDRLPVPEFFWRLDYDLQSRTGIVFVGYNGPFKNYDTIKQLCITTTCPYRAKKLLFQRDLYYCCFKEDFESAFGNFDPILYEEY